MTPKVVRRWVNWALVVAATVSVVAVLVTRNTWTSAERMVRSNHLVVGYRAAEIQRITLLVGGRKLVLARGRDAAQADDPLDPFRDDDESSDAQERPRWEFVEPYQGEAEEAAVDSLLRAIEFAPFLRKVDDATFSRRAAGLDAPQQTIELEMGSVRTRIHVGAVAPTPPNARYVEIGGEGTANKGVYVVSEATVKELLVSPDAFRVRQVVPYGAASLAEVRLRGDGKEVVMTASDHGDWRLVTAGKPVRLDRAAVQRLFAALSRSRAEQFVSDVASFDVEAPARVEATFAPKAKDKSPLTVRFGGACPTDSSLSLAVVEATPPLGACTVPLHLDTFLTRLPELLDRHLFDRHTDAVEELRVKAGERALELARRQEGWAMRLPEPGVVERDVGDAYVASILDVQGELTEKPEIALTPVATLSVHESRADEQQRAESVDVFAATSAEPRLWAHRHADDAWLALSPKHKSLFVPNVLLLKATQLFSLEANQLASVRIETSNWTQSFHYTRGPGGCSLEAPSGYHADSALCLDIIDELRVLRAKRWVAEADDGSFGLQQPGVRVTFTLGGNSGAATSGAEATAGDRGHAHHGDEPHDHEPPPEQSGRPLAGAPADVATGERTLWVGGRSPDGAYFARLSTDPAVFTLRPSVVEALSTLVVDRAPFLFDPQTVESLLVRSSAGEVKLRRLGDELIGGDVADPLALVDALSMVRPEAAVTLLRTGSSAAAPESYGFTRPLLDITVKRRVDDGTALPGDAPVREFRWVVGRGDVYRGIGIYYAMPVTSGPSAVFALPREVVQRLLDAL